MANKCLLLLIVMLISWSAATAQTGEVWIEPDTVYYQNNAFFRMSVHCDADLVGAKVFHFQFTFDPTILHTPPDSAQLGGLFAGLEEDSITVLFSQLWDDSAHLEVDIAYLRDSATLDGPGELVILPITPTGFGITEVQLTEVLIIDRFNQEIPVTIGNNGWARICQFVGDSNADNQIDIADIVHTVTYMFQEGPEPIPSVWAANFNCDSSPLDIADLVAQILWMFQDGPWICYPPCYQEP